MAPTPRDGELSKSWRPGGLMLRGESVKWVVPGAAWLRGAVTARLGACHRCWSMS
ncbi:MAG: hypothetical protein JO345_15300 [Streptosporangiaceae bacterium]|nr:hypothetical protein [Streptosporangiaceae bacterium]